MAKAISIRAPWWWFILHAGKDIENRDWPTSFRGTVYVHASKWWRISEISEDYDDACGMELRSGKIITRERPPSAEVIRDAGGCIVGKVDIVDCIRGYKRVCDASPWFSGEFGFVLANPVAFAKPIPCKGMLGFFTVPDEVLAQLEPVASLTDTKLGDAH